MTKNPQALQNILAGFYITLVVFLPGCSVNVEKMKEDAIKQQELSSRISCSKSLIAFAKDGDIYTISLEGDQLKRLTDDPRKEWSPIISPDEKRICFEKQGPLEDDPKAIAYDYNGIVCMNIDGTNQENIVAWQSSVLNLDVGFSPNGQKIVFQHLYAHPQSVNPSNRDRFRSIAEISIDGSDLRSLEIEGGNPTYSLDGNEIFAFSNKTILRDQKLQETGQIFAINRSNLETRVISEFPFAIYNVEFSSDRKKIIFTSRVGENKAAQYIYQIFYSSIDGSNRIQLTKDDSVKHTLAFSADDSSIFFLEERGKNRLIKKMKIDGEELQTIYQW